MENDDKNFQSQNFHVDGEENSKFSLGFRSYTLPKFNLDDNLQVPLRFDNLVESEVLLGIGSREESQWIDDFSRGESGIEFSTSAAKSCTISRHNNVWSEVTSSESVEMLLKSVGQDEMNMGHTVMPVTGVSAGMDSLTNQVELSSNQDDFSLPKRGDASFPVNSLQPDNCLQYSSVSPKNTVDELLQTEPTQQNKEVDRCMSLANQGEFSSNQDDFSLPKTENARVSVYGLPPEKCMQNSSSSANDTVDELIQIESTEQCNKVEKCLYQSLNDLHPNSCVDSCSLPLIGRDLLVHGKCEAVPEEENFLSDGSEGNKATDYSSKSESTQNCVEVLPMQEPVASACELDKGNVPEQEVEPFSQAISNKNHDVLNKDHAKKAREHLVVTKVLQMDDSEVILSESSVRFHRRDNVISSKDTEMRGQVTEEEEGTISLLEVDNYAAIKDADKAREHLVTTKEVQIGDLDFTNTVAEYGANNVEKPSSLPMKVDSVVQKQMIEISSEGILSESSVQVHERDNVSLLKDTEMGDQVMENKDEARNLLAADNSAVINHAEKAREHHVMREEPTNLLGVDNSVVINQGNADNLSSPAAELDPVVQIPEKRCPVGPSEKQGDFLEKNNNQLESLTLGSTAVEKKELLECVGDESSNYVGNHSSSMEVCLSTDTILESQTTDNLIAGNSCLVVHPTNLVTESDNSPSVQMRGRSSLGAGPSDIHISNPDVSVPESKNRIMLVASGLAENETDGSVNIENKVFSPSPHKNTLTSAVGFHESLPDFGQESASSTLVSEGIGLASQDKLDVHQQLLENCSAADDVIGHMGDVKPPSMVDDLDKKKGKLTTSYTEPSSLIDEPVLVSAVSENAGERPSVETSQSKSSMQSIGTKCQREHQETVTKVATQESCMDLEGDSIINQLATKEDDGVVVGASLQFAGYALNDCEGSLSLTPISKESVQSQVLESGSSGANADVSTCGSPTFISCCEPSRGENNQVEGGDGCLEQNAHVSDCKDQDVNIVGSDTSHCKENDVFRDDGNFSFEVHPLGDRSENRNVEGGNLFPINQHAEPMEPVSKTVDKSPTSPSLYQMDPKMLGEEAPCGSSQTSGGRSENHIFNGNTEHNTQSFSWKATDVSTFKEGKALRDKISRKHTNKKEINMGAPSSAGTHSQVVQAKEMQLYGFIEGGGTKPCAVSNVQAANVPDVNASAFQAALLKQPFSDHQQVQLRAQILVYGSLIQGAAPDEAYMVSIFGESERKAWEKVWRMALERCRNQKSPLSGKFLEQGTRQSAHQTRTLCTPPGRAGSKVSNPPMVNPPMSLSSPLWNIPNLPFEASQCSSMPRGLLLHSHQTPSPSHPYPSPLVNQNVGSSFWLSPVVSPVPFVVSPQTSALGATAKYPVSPISDAVHVTSVRQSSVRNPSVMHRVPPNPWSHAEFPKSSPTCTPLLGTKTTLLSPGNHASADSKPRKRKKTLEELGKIPLADHVAREPVSTSLDPHLSVTIPSPANTVVSTSSLRSSLAFQIGGRDMEQTVPFSEETCSRIEQAKLQAQEAATLAASAHRHSQSVWSQLAIQKNSGFVSDEMKLVSAAVAVAAASSVAKAAAAAAKLASDAAWQAKLMAEEVQSLSNFTSRSSEVPVIARSSGNMATLSNLKGKDISNNSSSLPAKEVVKKRVEATSAATQRAENLDAIYKAAELAADAVLQAGTIIAMGDPIPLTLSELLKAGPENYWKAQHLSSAVLHKATSMTGKEQGAKSDDDIIDISASHPNMQQSYGKETGQTMDKGEVRHPGIVSRQVVENNTAIDQHSSGGEKRIDKRTEIDKTIGVPNSGIGSRTTSIAVQAVECGSHDAKETQKENNIKESSLVEVQSNEGNYTGVWFPAKVLSLIDGKAYVSHSVLKDKGSHYVKEWVPLEGETGKTPRIRLAPSMTAMKHEGTRKRGREASGSHTWRVGDRVDALIRECWWEGVIMAKGKDDESNYTIHFPGQGETLVVQGLNLRPSIIWKDGQWMELSSSVDTKCYSLEGDTPHGKRVKLSSLECEGEARGSDHMSKYTGNVQLEDPEHPRALALSSKEKIFNVGKRIREDKGSDKAKRPGLQKEGSMVVFGVPKPGKKTKIVEVSKHYASNRGIKSSEGNSGKNLMNQKPKSHGWKNVSGVDYKGRGMTEQHKGKILKQGKPQSIPTCSKPEKDGSSTAFSSASNDGVVQDHIPNIKASVRHREKNLENKKLVEVGSFPNIQKGSRRDPSAFTTTPLPSDARSARKTISSAVEEDVSKGKIAPSLDKPAKHRVRDLGHINDPGKQRGDVIEPRRSNRRIQPTARLLEGIESSLISPKVSGGVSHSKGTKAQYNTPSRGNNR